MPAYVLIFDSNDSNMRYATGLSIPDPFVWIRFGEGKKAKEYILVSTLEFGRARQNAKIGTKVILLDKINLDNIRKPVGRKRNLADYAASFLLSYNNTEVVLPENTWASHLETLREHGIRAKIQSPYFAQRLIKSQDEIAKIKRTGLVAKKAYKAATDILRKATIDWNDSLLYNNKRLTSEFLKNEIERIFLENGCASGESIVSCAEQTAQPHNTGSGLLKAGEPIIIDIFPRDMKTGYFFDMTRTVIKGTPRKELKDLYATVHTAQLAAIAAVKAGAKVADVHQAVEEIYAKHNYHTTDEEGYIHSTGHGLGLSVHEPPRISTKSDEILQAGMVITIEPGLYYKELGGIRIEDTILVTQKGHVNLTNVPKVLVVR
jgi:Xaa-Pro aminopeptidase